MTPKIASLKPNTDPDALLREDEAARLLGVQPRSLQKWRSVGGGPVFVAISSRCIRYRRADLLRFAEDRLKTSTAA